MERRLLAEAATATRYKDDKEEALAYATLLHIEISGRQEYNVPFLEVTLRHHDVILGRT